MSDTLESDGGPIELAPRAVEVAAAPRAGVPVAEGETARLEKPVKKAAAPRLVERALWEAPEEAGGRTWVVMMVLVGLLGLYGWALASFYAGAHGGVDQNGYLMTARLIAGERNVDAPAAAAATRPAFGWVRERLSFVPESPYQFAGRMDVMTEPFGPASTTQPAAYRIYAKYPFGYPLMAAVGRWIGGLDGMYVVNPLCTVLACYFAFFLFRQAVSPFMSLLGVVWLACNPLVLNYANDANSHASTLFWVTVGAWGLVSWLRVGGFVRAAVGGLALGYACTIRYSEFLLVLPVVFAAGARLRLRRRSVWESVALVAAWALPVGVLAGVCWVCFGLPWKTGYTYCNESTGFGWKYLSGDMGEALPMKQGNWETFLGQLNRTGLFVMWPLALAGLMGMVGSVWRLGVTVALWVLPATGLYLLYYWAPTGETTIGYMRFFMSVMPGFIFAGVWVLEKGLLAVRGQKWASLWMMTAAGAGMVVVAGLVAADEAPVGGPGIVGQALGAAWGLAIGREGWAGAGFAWGVAGLVAGMWMFEREAVARKTALVLGAGAITALGCAVNVYQVAPIVQASHARWAGLRETVDEVRGHVPRGSAVFTGTTRFNDYLLNQLDAVGGYKLYSLTMFEQASFGDAKRRVENADKDRDSQADPDPVQVERERFYMELLGKQNAKGEWFAKSVAELRSAELGLIDGLLAGGHRVMFLSADGNKGMFPVKPGWELKEVTRWTAPPEVPAPRVARLQAKQIPPRRAASYTVLYELVKKAPAATKPG
jgi:hypothetical protein